MVILEISTDLFDDILEAALRRYKPLNWQQIFTEVSYRMAPRALSAEEVGKDPEESPVYLQGCLIQIVADIVMILRNNYVDFEREAFIAEECYKNLLKHAEENPMM